MTCSTTELFPSCAIIKFTFLYRSNRVINESILRHFQKNVVLINDEGN